jgi:hypothetical protein
VSCLRAAAVLVLETVTVGAPISREFMLMDAPVQLFQNAALHVQPNGSVQVVRMTDSPLPPYSHFNGLIVPSADPAIALVVPGPDQPNYTARLPKQTRTTPSSSTNGSRTASCCTTRAWALLSPCRSGSS